MKNKIPFQYRITTLYVIIGASWILFSDRLVFSLTKDPQQINILSIYKGWFYVLITGILLFIMVKKEIKKRNNLYDELLKASEKALESDQLKSAFLSNLSHYIRTPMNSILGFAELVQNRNLDTEKRNRFLNLINERSQQLLQTINNIMEISKIQEGQTMIEKKTFSIKHLLNKLIIQYKQEIENNDHPVSIYQTITIDSDNDFINSDYSKILHILSNLISNAIKYTEYGEIEIGCDMNNNGYTFFVRDTGTGISQEKKNTLFQNFMQGHPDIQDIKEGSGLGLFSSSQLAFLLGGKLWLDYSSDKGTRFCLSILK